MITLLVARGYHYLFLLMLQAQTIMVICRFHDGRSCMYDDLDNPNQRTNGPVNAHLRSAAYTNKHV